MPFAVSQWPYTPDPRTAQFDQMGWDYGQVPPWAWILSTTGATGPFAVFNNGVIVKPFAAGVDDTLFRQVVTLPDDITVRLTSKGFNPPLGGPGGTSKRLSVRIAQPEFQEASGVLNKNYPTAIAEQGPMTIVVDDPPIGTFPNPMAITPAKWNV